VSGHRPGNALPAKWGLVTSPEHKEDKNMGKITVENGMITIAGNYLQRYNEQSDTMSESCPVHFENCTLEHIDEDCMILIPGEYAKVIICDAVGNIDEAWEDLCEVTDASGTVWEIRNTFGDFCEVRKKGFENWEEATWSIFCEEFGVELDAIA